MALIAVALPVVNADGVDRALGLAREAKEHGADIVEWRVDSLVEAPAGIAAALRLVKESPLPCIVTVRDEGEGGAFAGTPEERIAAWKALARCDPPPAYIDMELSAVRESGPARECAAEVHRASRDSKVSAPRVILSFHDFRGRPPGLSARVAEMWSDPCASISKVVWTARTARDNIEAFELLLARAKPTIALCMGEHGLMSRVLAGKFGGFLTYARGDEHGTASGQPTVRELTEEWRIRSIDERTRVYAVLGHPVAHSRSPKTHNEWFARAGVNARMFAVAVAPAWESFKATLGELIAFAPLHFSGAAVTAPHKQSALRFVDEAGGHVDPLARRIGAVNTISISQGKLLASNTDAHAIASVVASEIRRDRRGDALPGALEGARVLVLGAGGAARAAVVGLGCAGCEIVLSNRTPRSARALAAEFGAGSGDSPPLRVTALAPSALHGHRFDVVVNATSAGMAGGPDPNKDPLPGDVIVDSGTLVFDCVYEPVETPLICRARSAGARVCTGEAMFAAQAMRQFEVWTGSLPAQA